MRVLWSGLVGVLRLGWRGEGREGEMERSEREGRGGFVRAWMDGWRDGALRLLLSVEVLVSVCLSFEHVHGRSSCGRRRVWCG